MATIQEKLGRPNGPYHHGLLSHLDCSTCPLRNTIKVYPDGPVPAALAFVGEEPGRQELGVGRGFVGPSGRLLWLLAQQIGHIMKETTGYDIHITREQVWVTNSALCKAMKVRLPNGGYIPLVKVKAAAQQHCRARLINELRVVDPIVTVPLGGWSLWSVKDIEKAKIYAFRGSRMLVDLDELAYKIATGTVDAPTRTVGK